MTTSVRELHAAIDDLDGIAARCPAERYDELVVDLDRELRRLTAVKLSVVAAAEQQQVAARSGLADTSSWLARRTRSGAVGAAADVRLATALAPGTGAGPRPTSTALTDGAVSIEHARVIIRATEELPDRLSPIDVEKVERALVERAADLSPDQLRREARRAIAVVEADQAEVDRHEDALLRAEERSALDRTRLTCHDNGDGTTSGHFTVPTTAASVLIRAVQSMTSPRRAHLGAPAAQAGDPDGRRDWAHQSGLAFTELLEHLPSDRLHSKVAATVVVTIDLGKLLASVGAAHLDVDHAISAAEVRRLACASGILPAVLGGAGQVLDLGRTSRCFTESQRIAVAVHHRTCAARGCERPFAWCELHHRDPWCLGGRTDLDQAVPLCGFHHRRIHDPDYEHAYTGDGVIFTRQR
ncbi:MAG: DUF222 domain-containing protein [Marmoricola sp.]